MTTDTNLTLVMHLERELQTSACRTNRTRVLELLAPDFTEIGASGRFWTLPTILDQLAANPTDPEEIEATNLTGRPVANGLLLLHWYATHHTRRSSLRRHAPNGWHLVHHQATVLPH